MFELYLRRDNTAPWPTDPTAFIAAQSGYFKSICTPAFAGVVPATEAPMLAEVKTWAEWKLPPIPAALGVQIERFFRRVCEAHGTEAMLRIAYAVADARYAFVAPIRQEVSAGGIRNAQAPFRPPEGYAFVGTVHSHGRLPAYHSDRDKHDEESFDGLHVTFGNFKEEADSPIEIVASLAIGGHRFVVDPKRVFEGAVVAMPPLPMRRKPPYVPKEAIAVVRALFDGRPIGALPDAFQEQLQLTEDADTALRQYVEDLLTELEYRQECERQRPIGYRIATPEGTPPEALEPPAEWFASIVVEKPQYETEYDAMVITTGVGVHEPYRSEKKARRPVRSSASPSLPVRPSLTPSSWGGTNGGVHEHPHARPEQEEDSQ